MKKLEKVLLFILIISICLISGFFAYKHFHEKKIIVSSEIETILGDEGSCGRKSGAPSYCNNVKCGNMSESSCKSSSTCCSWTAAKATPKPCSEQCKNAGSQYGYCMSQCTGKPYTTATPKPTSKPTAKPTASPTPKPTATPTPTPTPKPCSEQCANAGSQYNYCMTQCTGKPYPTPTPTPDNRPCCNICGGTAQCLANCKSLCGCKAGYGEVTEAGVLKCKKCSSDEYSPDGSKACKFCYGKVSSDGGKCTNAQTCAKDEYWKDGKCTKCYGQLNENSQTGRKTCTKECEINFKAVAGKLGPTEVNNGVPAVIWEAKNCAIPVFSIDVSGATLVGNNSTRVPGGNIFVVGIKPCDAVTVTVSAYNGGVTRSVTIPTDGRWVDGKNGDFPFSPPPSEAGANVASYDVYSTDGCRKITNSLGETVWHCDSYKSRSCGGGVPQRLSSYCCVDNGVPGLSKNVFYVQSVNNKDCSSYAKRLGYPDVSYTLLENVTKDKCKAPDKIVGMCTESSTTPARQEKEASTCETEVKISTSDGVKCSNTSETAKGFYKIDCDRYVDTNFDYGNDGKTDTDRTVVRGEGIPLGINVSSSIKCTYEFYNDNWKTIYNNVLSRIRKVDSKLESYVKNNDSNGWKKYIDSKISKITGVKETKLLYEWWNIIEDLKEIVRYYNSYEPEMVNNNQTAVVSITTKENGKSITTNYNFSAVVTNSGKVTKTDKFKKAIGINGLDDPYNYKSSNISNPTKVTLIPKKTCIDITSGNIVATIDSGDCPKNSIDGGNKMYINYDTDITKDEDTYPITITVSGLSINDSKVTNNKCSIKVIENTLKYRSIDVKNPFINDDWEKGYNWTNSEYDFTKTIHSSTWSEGTYNKIKISSSDIEALQKSNSKNKALSPYLGLCDKVDKASQDAITQKLCKLIK